MYEKTVGGGKTHLKNQKKKAKVHCHDSALTPRNDGGRGEKQGERGSRGAIKTERKERCLSLDPILGGKK